MQSDLALAYARSKPLNAIIVIQTESSVTVRNELNTGVLEYLGKREVRGTDQPEVSMPADAGKDYYWESGAHPEIVQRLWDDLGARLPGDARALVLGTPALVHPASGVVLAFALGTEYALRLPPSISGEQLPPGVRTVAAWTGGGTTDIQKECGRDWILGSYSGEEGDWCERSFLEFSGALDSKALEMDGASRRR